ncbi:MAG TPA: polyphosphate polymerase domain-containing protein [Kofleriaceae bacterium]
MIQRREYKYLIDERTAARVRSFISGLCSVDEYAARTDGRYICDTLYLDTLRRSSYHATIENASDRYKVRVRKYVGAEPVFLEVKRRVDDTIIKTRAKLGPDWVDYLEQPTLLKQLRDPTRAALSNFIRCYDTVHGPMLPAVLVRYEREPYSSTVDDYVRVTFDRKIEYQPKGELSLDQEIRHWVPIDSTAVVLELKFNDPAPSWMMAMVRSLELPRAPNCKYTLAIDSMLLAPTGRISTLYRGR